MLFTNNDTKNQRHDRRNGDTVLYRYCIIGHAHLRKTKNLTIPGPSVERYGTRDLDHASVAGCFEIQNSASTPGNFDRAQTETGSGAPVKVPRSRSRVQYSKQRVLYSTIYDCRARIEVSTILRIYVPMVRDTRSTILVHCSNSFRAK